MKLPANTVIVREKVTRYLLVPQTRGDKSGFLERAGYTQEDADLIATTAHPTDTGTECPQSTCTSPDGRGKTACRPR